MIKIGSHVGMSGKDMFLNSAREAASYGANTFMVYTGAPQNTRRREISELNIEAAHAYMKEHGIDSFVVHAPYIINLGNSVKPETFELAVEFLATECERTLAMGSNMLILHPGAHVGAGTDAGTAQIIKGLNEVLSADSRCLIALETMAGKGTEIGRNFEELAAIYDGVVHNDKLRVCFDMILSMISTVLSAILTRLSAKTRLPSFISMTAKMPAARPKTAMKTSERAESALKPCTGLSITRISWKFQKYSKPLISRTRTMQKRKIRPTGKKSSGCCNNAAAPVFYNFSCPAHPLSIPFQTAFLLQMHAPVFHHPAQPH